MIYGLNRRVRMSDGPLFWPESSHDIYLLCFYITEPPQNSRRECFRAFAIRDLCTTQSAPKTTTMEILFSTMLLTTMEILFNNPFICWQQLGNGYLNWVHRYEKSSCSSKTNLSFYVHNKLLQCTFNINV